ncbi:sensory rhodopsin-2 [Haloplanus rubicundus]|uniref:Sensory rhodopsin-2 n=1 Tax=Haloplanus rubicundus TaxID=1547898 RepID=A0A345EA46_9EURY|nr:bacteriorhodopsin [Haloplanus rubicundus]AXG05732.1 sensory rhodopsin-2 [Haloplanus rubicundus]AXG09068.1 sensory rhodopsin-2 [Haloplanus rubicundus]
MISTATTWAAVGAIGMALGTIPPLWGLRNDPARRTHYLALAGVTGVATVAYALMAFDVGTITASGRVVSIPRYVDWLITTPLILLFLAMLGRTGRGSVLRLVVADVVLLLLGGIAVVLTGPIRWAVFAGGVVCFGVLVYDLYVRIPRLATFSNERTRILFVTLRNLTIALWTLYPVVWVLAPSGLGLLTRDMAMLVIAYLDLISKAAFVALAVDGMDAIADADRAETGAVRVDDGDSTPTAD